MDRFCQNVPNGRFVANPRSCQHWIFCQNQVALEGQCEGIFYFDENLQMCRYPIYVDCAFGQVDVECSENFELLPHPENCDQYVACIQGFPRIMSCADGLHWNARTSQCDLIENAQCVIRVREHSGFFHKAPASNLSFLIAPAA